MVYVGYRYNFLTDSYLSDREQCVVNVMSTNKQITCGVPQGSILGPILFLIYINDIYRCSAKLQFILFADDTTIVYVGNDWSEVSTVVNQELSILSNWFKVNQLSLNLTKTNYIAFNRSSPSPNLSI